MDSTLSNKVALVTGAAGPMGKAVVKGFVEQGCVVAMVDISQEGLLKNRKEFGQRVYCFPVDITQYEAVKATCGEIEKELEGVDILVNNAGILSNNKVLETSPEEWKKVISVNLDGAFYLSQQVIPYMIKGEI